VTEEDSLVLSADGSLAERQLDQPSAEQTCYKPLITNNINELLFRSTLGLPAGSGRGTLSGCSGQSEWQFTPESSQAP